MLVTCLTWSKLWQCCCQHVAWHVACPILQFCRSKAVRLELVLLETAVEPGSAATDALAAAWAAAEAAFPHLSVTVVQGAGQLTFSALASTLLQRCAPQQALAVSLQVRCQGC